MLFNLCSMLWPATELSVKGVQSLRNRKKNNTIPARPYINKFSLRVKLTDIMIDSLEPKEHIFSDRPSFIEPDKSFITS